MSESCRKIFLSSCCIFQLFNILLQPVCHNIKAINQVSNFTVSFYLCSCVVLTFCHLTYGIRQLFNWSCYFFRKNICKNAGNNKGNSQYYPIIFHHFIYVIVNFINAANNAYVICSAFNCHF